MRSDNRKDIQLEKNHSKAGFGNSAASASYGPAEQNRLFLGQLLVLAAGLLAGLCAGLAISRLPWDFSRNLEQARELGIVSRTIIDSYPKGRDLITCFALLVMPVAGALSLWIIWAWRRRSELAELLSVPAESRSGRDPFRLFLLAVLLVIYLVISLVAADFIFVGYVEHWGSWGFLGEEGENLAWAQRVLEGGVYARDFFSLYGPMLIYPLAWFMKLFGTTVISARAYTWCLDLLAFTIYLTVFHRTIGSRRVFCLTSLLFCIIFSHILYMSPNTTILRVALGILPLFLLYRWAEEKNRWHPFAAGLAVGQSLLFSQEVGVCACIAMAAMLMTHAVRERSIRPLIHPAGTASLGAAISMLPMLSYLALNGALGESLKSLYLYPRLVTLGYGGLPFPGILNFFQTPFASEVFPALWIIAVYVVTAIVLTILIVFRRLGPVSFFCLGLLVFGVLLFRSALGRSDLIHYMFVAPPALLLLFLCLDSAVMRAGNDGFPAIRLSREMSGIISAILLVPIVTHTPAFDIQISLLRDAPDRLKKLQNLSESRTQRYTFERAGVLFNDKNSGDLLGIRSFLDRETKPGDYVMFFPNEAAYYFLFNRRNPTRYVLSYFAATSMQRREMVADLEKNRPEYVIYSLATWRIDEIPERMQVPEVLAYIMSNYEPFKEFGTVMVMRRRRG